MFARKNVVKCATRNADLFRKFTLVGMSCSNNPEALQHFISEFSEVLFADAVFNHRL
jgi:hypothetical protein